MTDNNPHMMPKQIRPLRELVEEVVDNYLKTLDGHKPCDLHDMVISEAEHALIATVMKHSENNQSRAAECLNLNRGTLRKKLRQYQLLK